MAGDALQGPGIGHFQIHHPVNIRSYMNNQSRMGNLAKIETRGQVLSINLQGLTRPGPIHR